MSEILAFIKAHRRDIIITASALAASLVVMLLIPALIVGNAPSTAGMLACIALFFAVDPAFCLAAAIFAGFTPQVVHRAVPAARVPDFDRRGFRL